MQNLNRIACGFIRVIGVFFIGYIFLQGLYTICCIQRVEELTYYMKNDVFRQVAGIALFGIIVFFLQKKKDRYENFLKKNETVFLGILLAVVLLSFTAWIMVTRFWYFGDMEKIYQYAGMILAGDFSGWMPGGYPYEWTQQNTLILFVVGLLKIFDADASFLAFYFINLFFYGVALVAITMILHRFATDRMTYIAEAVMVMLYFPFGFLILMLYGDMIGFSFGCVSMAFLVYYLDSRKIWQILASCICIIVAVNFRQNETIIFLGILIILLMDWLKNSQSVGRLGIFIIYIGIAFIGFSVPGKIIEGMGNVKMEGGNSRWAHVAMGLQESDKAPGWYNNYVDEVFEGNNYNKLETAKAAKADIGARLKFFKEDPVYAWRFFHKKLASEWNNPTFECFHIQNWRNTSLELSPVVKSIINDGGKLNILLIDLLDLAQSIVLFGVMMYLICVKTTDLRQLLFMILFIGGFLFFAFWEAKCRYVLPFYFLLIPYAYSGYAEMIRQKRIKTATVIMVLIAWIGISQNSWICDAFKLNADTDAYYEYIHQYNHNFENFRF